jgi:hypothetical protein
MIHSRLAMVQQFLLRRKIHITSAAVMVIFRNPNMLQQRFSTGEIRRCVEACPTRYPVADVVISGLCDMLGFCIFVYEMPPAS